MNIIPSDPIDYTYSINDFICKEEADSFNNEENSINSIQNESFDNPFITNSEDSSSFDSLLSDYIVNMQEIGQITDTNYSREDINWDSYYYNLGYSNTVTEDKMTQRFNDLFSTIVKVDTLYDQSQQSPSLEKIILNREISQKNDVKTRKVNRKWAKWEDDLLLELVGKGKGFDVIANVLSRPKNSISGRLKKIKMGQQNHGVEKGSAVRWTSSQDEILKAHIDNGKAIKDILGDKELLLKLNRTPKSIRSRYSMLINKNRIMVKKSKREHKFNWTKEEDLVVLDCFQNNVESLKKKAKRAEKLLENRTADAILVQWQSRIKYLSRPYIRNDHRDLSSAQSVNEITDRTQI